MEMNSRANPSLFYPATSVSRRSGAGSAFAQDIFRAKYTASFVSGYQAERNIWTDNVSVNTVLARFSRLTKDKRIPVDVQKKIRSSLEQ